MSSFTTILVFLDGYRLPSDVSWMKEDSRVYTFDEWIIIRDYEEFVSYIDTIGVPRVISFGYNLLSKDKTGYNCAEYLIEYCSRYDLMPPVQLCHSTNKKGKKEINILWDKFIDILFKHNQPIY